MSPRGKFVVITGPDGCGKTTLVGSLNKLYKTEILFTREPGGTKVAEIIRNEILSKRAKNFRPISQLLHFFCARANLLEMEVGPALASGRNVISDRFDESTFAYQVSAQDGLRANGARELEALFWLIRRKLVLDTGLTPDLYIFVDVPVEVGMGRRRQARGEMNHLDERDKEFHQRVNEGLREFFKKSSVRYTTIDGRQSQDRVLEDCLSVLEPLMGVPQVR